jgi:hypothetical protein
MTNVQSSPLRYLSPAAQKAFLDSLTFNENGLTGFKSALLEADLTPTQIEEVLALFGHQRLVIMFPKAKVSSPRDKELLAVALTVSKIGESSDPSAICADCWATPGDDWDWGGGGGMAPPAPAPAPAPTPRPPTYPQRDYPGMYCMSELGHAHTCALRDGHICMRSC